jgi:hypothetical protein
MRMKPAMLSYLPAVDQSESKPETTATHFLLHFSAFFPTFLTSLRTIRILIPDYTNKKKNQASILALLYGVTVPIIGNRLGGCIGEAESCWNKRINQGCLNNKQNYSSDNFC